MIRACQILKKKWKYGVAVHEVFIDIKIVEVEILLYNIPIEFTVCGKLVRIIKMWIIKTCSKVFVGKFLSDMFCIQNGLLFNFSLEFSINNEELYNILFCSVVSVISYTRYLWF
jgi:hypothetical protein